MMGIEVEYFGLHRAVQRMDIRLCRSIMFGSDGDDGGDWGCVGVRDSG